MIFIIDREYLIKYLRMYSKELKIEIKNNKRDYEKLMLDIEKINKKNSYTQKIRILKRENSILNEDIILEIKKSYLNSKNIRIITLKKINNRINR